MKKTKEVTYGIVLTKKELRAVIKALRYDLDEKGIRKDESTIKD